MAYLLNLDRIGGPLLFARDVVAVAVFGLDRGTPGTYAREQEVISYPEPEYDIPPADNYVELSMSQLRWCMMMEARMGVIEGFAASDDEKQSAVSLWKHYYSACISKRYGGISAILASPEISVFGLSVVKDAVSVAKASNPRLVWSEKAGSIKLPGGIRGAEVLTEVQHILNFLGFEAGTADGRFDSETFTAVRHFQRTVGLPDTGTVDEATVALLRCSLFAMKYYPISFRHRS
jgi:hypothetical protein